MYKTNIFLTIFLTFILTAHAQETQKIPAEKPKLIVGIVVEQMRFDYIHAFWNQLQPDGLKKLVSEGTYCANAHLEYSYTQSASGYATIATGTNPSHHGIIGNDWYVRFGDRSIESTRDNEENAVGGSYEYGLHSPRRLMSGTLSDEIKLSNKFQSKVIGVCLEPAGAILAAGHTADGAYWYDGVNGEWMSSTYYMDDLPKWVKEFNKKEFADTYLERTWQPLMETKNYNASLPDSNIYEKGYKDRNMFPYNIDELSKVSRRERDYSFLKQTPFGINLTKDFAIAAILGEELGKDEFTDVLQVGFSSPGNIGAVFGPSSMEVQDAILRLDWEIAHLVRFLDNNIGMENVLIYLTSDRGVSEIPQYLSDNNIPSGYFMQNQALSLLISYLNIVYGSGNWVQSYNNLQVYLNRQLIEDSKLKLEDVQTTVARFMLQFSGVTSTITATDLVRTNYTTGIFSKIQNSYNQKRSGDVFLILEPGWIEKGKYATFNNSHYHYDSHVPLVWYGWKTGRQVIYKKIGLSSIAPTISALMQIQQPNNATGEIIESLMK